jgi:hypothetical protein
MMALSLLPTVPTVPKPELEPHYVGVLRHRLHAALSENRRLKRELFTVRQEMQQRLARLAKRART